MALGSALLSLAPQIKDRAEAREAVSGALDVYMQAAQEHRRKVLEKLLRQIDEELERLPPP